MSDRGIGYGIRSLQIDGNNILEVYQTLSKVAAELRNKPEPILIECMTFRQRGHEEASGVKYVPKALMDYWTQRDPVKNFEQFLLDENILSEAIIQEEKAKINKQINAALELSYQEAYPVPSIEKELNAVFQVPKAPIQPNSQQSREVRFIEAIAQALDQAMTQYDELVLMGQDIAEYGGVFKITKGLVEKYGRARVRNTPLCESAIIGIGLGLSLKGYKAMVEMQFADFVSCGFNQIVNNLAKIHYRWGATADVVIRMPCGGSVGAGPFHSQTNEAWFFKVPGLKIVYPSNPVDAKGLLLASLADPNPVLFFEHKALYRSLSAEVPTDYYTLEIGKANLVKQGNQATIITYGLGVIWAKEVAETTGFSLDILDLRSLAPLDYAAIEQSVKKTHRVLLLHEDTLTGGVGAELSAYIAENLFHHLDAPIRRVASLDTPVPFTKTLEEQFLPVERLEKAIRELVHY